MDKRFPNQGQGPRPQNSMGMPSAFELQQNASFAAHLPHQGHQGWNPQQQQMVGQMNFIPMVPSVSASVATPVRMMHQQPGAAAQASGKDRNYLAQQQKLRAMAGSFKPGPVSADSLIDDLLQKKETFTVKPQVSAAQAAKLADKSAPVQLQVDKLMQQVPQEIHVPPEMSSEGMAGFGLTSPVGAPNLPYWLQPDASDLLPAVYRRVWELSKAPGADGRELVDTGKIFAVLVTSGLPRDSLGYIWNLANTGIPGVLSRSELNVALALVALAQNGLRDFSNIAVLSMVQQPPVPSLQLETFSAPQQAKPSQPATPQVLHHPEPIPAAPAKDLLAVKPEKQDILPTISQQVSSTPLSAAGLLDDDFSDFQAAPPANSISVSDFSPVFKGSQQHRSSIASRDSPLGFNSFESPPTSPVFTPKPSSNGKGSREVGSRLANYSFTAPSSSSGSRKSETDNEEDVFKSDELFPKCVVRDKSPVSASAPQFLKETVIRTEPDENKFVAAESTPVNMKKDDDKYSALRDLEFGSLSTAATPPTTTAVDLLKEEPAVSQDDFGDFLSADDSFAELSKRETTASNNAPTQPENFGFDFDKPPEPISKDWNASFEAFADKSSGIDDVFWKSEPTPLEQTPVTNIPDIPADEDDFGDFIGPTTPTNVSVLPYLSKIKDSSTITPDTQSVASLELGGFDSLSVGGAGPSSSPDGGGGGGLLDLKIGSEIGWETQLQQQQDEGMEWKQCLHSCIHLLQAAAQIFLAIDDPNVVEEVVTSKQGEDYLANLLEVYFVTQRINVASRKLLPASRHLLEPLLMEVESVWNTLRPFLEQSSLEVKDEHWNVLRESTNSCSLCLTQVEDTAVGSMALVRSGSNCYHAACANLWLNCINAQLPAILVP
ncbi:synergin gamma-like isoform X2 [Cloeon dipterum]|uniref:synergin gamma-like isoform X2 n=1 Tax=Cloeon dipterum TaxID=197152 RepID=UPI0032207265